MLRIVYDLSSYMCHLNQFISLCWLRMVKESILTPPIVFGSRALYFLLITDALMFALIQCFI